MKPASKNKPETPKGLPFKQRLALENKPKLKELIKAYPHLAFCLADTALAVNVADVFKKVGFTIHPMVKQDVKLLSKNLANWLANDYLVLLHFKPASPNINLISLLKLIKGTFPQVSFKNLVPVIMISHYSQKQHDIFKLLGTYGIRSACFLEPAASLDIKMEGLLKELVHFNSLLEIGFQHDQKASTGKEEKDIEKIRKYKELVKQGEDLMEKARYEEAIELFSKAIALKPDFEALMDRGDAYYKSKKYVPALNDYREAYKCKHSVPEPYAKISACCFTLIRENIKKEGMEKAKKWFALGIKHLKDAVRLNEILLKDSEMSGVPNTAYGSLLDALVIGDLRGLGLKGEEEQLWEISSKLVKEIITWDHLDGELDVDVRIDKAILLARSGYYEEAEEIFRQIIREAPSNTWPTLNNFAVELRKNGEVGRAFEIYLEILEHDIPDKDIVIENLKTAGVCHAARLREEFKQEEAIPVYKKILTKNPKGKEWILLDFAMTLLEKQNQAKASLRLMEAIYINPRLMELEKFKQSYSDLGNLQEEMIKKLTGQTDSQR